MSQAIDLINATGTAAPIILDSSLDSFFSAIDRMNEIIYRPRRERMVAYISMRYVSSDELCPDYDWSQPHERHDLRPEGWGYWRKGETEYSSQRFWNAWDTAYSLAEFDRELRESELEPL